MKKLLFVLILVTHLVFGVFCQSSNSSGPMDLIVLLDTSASMSASYRETSDYLIGPFLKEFLRIGDTFHLISFSAAPRLEISRLIEGQGDVETIIARMLLMYPLDPESNLSGALSFAESFTSSLPSRSKKVILISDGDAANTQSLVDGSTSRFRGLGSDFQYIKVPVTGNGPGSGRAAPAQTASSQGSQTTQTAQQGSQTAQGSAQGTTQGAQTAQSTQQNETAQTTQTAQGAQTSPSQSAQTTESAQPESSSQGTQGATQAGSSQAQTSAGPAATQESSGASGPAQIQPQSPAQGTGQTQTAQASSSGIAIGNIPTPLIIALALLLLLILILIIIFASRRLHKSPNRVISKAASPASSASSETKASQYTETRKTEQVLGYPPTQMRPLPKDKVYDENTLPSDGSPLMLNLFVLDQNTAIGKRNIHSLKPGYSFTVGGGNSDFLIFLVPVPPNIAEVRLDGRNCTFTPRKPQYFPDIGSQSVSNCIGKTFRVISDKKYELHIRLERYEDPLHALNKMLRSIKVPGPVV